MRFNSVAPQTLGVRVKFDLHTASIVDGELQCLMLAARSQMLHIDVLGSLVLTPSMVKSPEAFAFKVPRDWYSVIWVRRGQGVTPVFGSELCRYTSSIPSCF